MPCTELFEQQSAAYRADLLPRDTLTISIEAGVTLGWERYTGRDGLNFGINGFGASAPAEILYDHFGLTAEKIVPQIIAELS
jgi:transketolase